MPKKRDEKKNEGCKVNIVREHSALIIKQGHLNCIIQTHSFSFFCEIQKVGKIVKHILLFKYKTILRNKHCKVQNTQ